MSGSAPDYSAGKSDVGVSLQFSFLQTFSISFVSSSGCSIAAVSVSAPYVQLSTRGVCGASLILYSATFLFNVKLPSPIDC